MFKSRRAALSRANYNFRTLENKSAIFFAGNDEELAGGDTVDLDSSHFTISVWAKIAGTNDFTIFCQKYKGSNDYWAWKWLAGDSMQFVGKKGAGGFDIYIVSTDFTLVLPEWYNKWAMYTVVCHRNTASKCKVFLNGNDVTSGTPLTSVATMTHSGGNFSVGKWLASSLYPMTLGEVVIYRDALTDEAVKEMYNKGRGVNHNRWGRGSTLTEQLVSYDRLAWYRMGDGYDNAVAGGTIYNQFEHRNPSLSPGGDLTITNVADSEIIHNQNYSKSEQ